MRSDAFVRAVVGPVGSGKSSASVMEIVRRAVQQAAWTDSVRRSRFVVIRNTYRELKDTTRKTFEQWVPSALGRWKEQDFTFHMDFPLPDGTRVQSEVLFRALDRPEDVKKLLSLELTGAYINEAREVPKSVFDVLQSRVGRYPSMAQGGPTWFGVWLDTNPWHTGHWGYRLFSKDTPEGFELYEQPGGRSSEAENLENLVPGYYERLTAGKDSEWVAEYVDSKYPSHDKGSIYGDLIAALEARGGLLAFEHPVDDLFTAWDLGRSDSTAIWFFRFGQGGVEVVDFHENHGQSLSHYFGVLDARTRERGYRYVKHYLPHDARAKTLSTQVSILDQALSRFGPGAVEIIPALDVLDGIQAARALLESSIRIHARCDESPLPGVASGIEALRSYKYAWDEKHKVFTRLPLHDWSSHAADGFRYLALAERKAGRKARSIQPPPSPPPVKAALPTFDEFWSQRR
jgi:hypothetical protein